MLKMKEALDLFKNFSLYANIDIKWEAERHMIAQICTPILSRQVSLANYFISLRHSFHIHKIV